MYEKEKDLWLDTSIEYQFLQARDITKPHTVSVCFSKFEPIIIGRFKTDAESMQFFKECRAKGMSVMRGSDTIDTSDIDDELNDLMKKDRAVWNENKRQGIYV